MGWRSDVEDITLPPHTPLLFARNRQHDDSTLLLSWTCFATVLPVQLILFDGDGLWRTFSRLSFSVLHLCCTVPFCFFFGQFTMGGFGWPGGKVPGSNVLLPVMGALRAGRGEGDNSCYVPYCVSYWAKAINVTHKHTHSLSYTHTQTFSLALNFIATSWFPASLFPC